MRKMKKAISILLALCLMLAGGLALADQDILAELEGQTLVFASGAGAWETMLSIDKDGAFTGEYHDSEMGETGEGYPDGTVYSAFFEGRFTDVRPVTDSIYTMKVTDFSVQKMEEVIEDGIRWAVSEPYGIAADQTVTLYLPGTKLSDVAEDFEPWSHLSEMGYEGDDLPYYAIWNEAGQSGFVGDPLTDRQDEMLGLVNPWRETDENGLAGFAFGVPEGAQNVHYLMNDALGMAEMRFELGEATLNARFLMTGAFTDISGMYYRWTGVESYNEGLCVATLWTAGGDGAPVALCLMYDMESGAMFSLSVQGVLPAGVSLKDLAATVCVPVVIDG